MFFGKGNSLEQWLRTEHAAEVEGWDGYSIEVHAVRTKGQLVEDMMCVILMNKHQVMHRTFVIDPATGKAMHDSNADLAQKFIEEYLPHLRHLIP